MMMIFGIFGYALMKWKCEPAPLLLAFVLGPLIEENFRRSMLISLGDPTTFVTRPISLSLLIVAAALIALIVVPGIRRARAVAFQE
jgi:putative tricarboxylic transport membrane protein